MDGHLLPCILTEGQEEIVICRILMGHSEPHENRLIL